MNKNISLKISIASLVVSNAWLPIQLLQRNFVFSDVLLVYWLEIAIVGGFMSLKWLISSVVASHGIVWKVGEVGVALSYIFVISVTVFAFMFLSWIGITYYIPGGVEKSSWLQLVEPRVWHAAYILLASHIISFIVNFLLQEEYKKWATHLLQPGGTWYGIFDLEYMYGRFYAVFFACLGGSVLAFFSHVLGDYISLPSISVTIFASIIFVIIKIVLDIRAHLEEHGTRH